MAACLHLATVARPTGRYAPSRRPRRAPLAAAASPADFSPEQLQAGLQQQLRGNGEQAAVIEPSAFTSQVPPKKASRREERAAAAAAAAEAEAAARRQSEETQRQLGHRAPDDAAVIAAALRTQLRQSGTFDEAEPASNGGAAEAASAEPAAAGPGTVLEDGSVVFKF